jgi:hypothetical protein
MSKARSSDGLNVALDPDPMRLGPPGHRIPPLLRKNIITSVEAEKLFKMYTHSCLSPLDYL